MVTLRLTRVGKKKYPIFRMIAIDKARDPWGKAIEILGTINPHTKERQLKADRIKYWLSTGAQPSATVQNILVDEKLMDVKKASVSSLSKKRRGKMEEKEAEARAKEEEAKAKAAEEAEVAKAAAEAEAQAAEGAKAEEPAEAPAAEEAPAEEPAKEEAPAEEAKEESAE